VLSIAVALALCATVANSLIAAIPLSLVFIAITALRLLAVRAELSVESRPRVPDARLPVYTVLVPLYRESRCLPELIQALDGFDYPAVKLDVKLLVEEGDRETRSALERVHLPGHFEVLVLPDGQPRTKPRALNMGLVLARGSFVAVFDAEDRPDSGQLREALHAFARTGPHLGCVQARLAIDNIRDHPLTRLFALEYAGLFDALLPALSRSGLFFPLGGTSNHFRTEVLDRLGGWDAWNVTEDADLGVRLARAGYASTTIASTTYEEAPNTFHAWLKQRTRWLKGYALTWMVHMRSPRRLLRDLGWRNFLVFQAFIGGVPLSAIMLPIFLTSVFAHTAAGLWLTGEGGWAHSATEGLELLNLVLGFGTAIALGAIGADRRNLSWLNRWLPLMPLYWLLGSAAMWRATFQMLHAPHLWEKTEHGLARTSRMQRLKNRTQLVDDLGGGTLHVQRPDEAAIAVHDVDKRRVVHRVGAVVQRHLLRVGTVGLDHRLDRGGVTRDAPDSRVEA
jgi:glycosyltransferase involved in cell wall biosynthesis